MRRLLSRQDLMDIPADGSRLDIEICSSQLSAANGNGDGPCETPISKEARQWHTKVDARN